MLPTALESGAPTITISQLPLQKYSNTSTSTNSSKDEQKSSYEYLKATPTSYAFPSLDSARPYSFAHLFFFFYLPKNHSATLHPSPVLAFSNPRSHAFSTSSSASESRTRRRSRLVRKTNLEKKSSLAKAHQESQPDPVLGYAKGRESIWENSLLKSVLLRREDVWGETVKVLPDETASTSRRGQAPETIGGDKSSAQIAERTYFPKHFNFGLGEEEVKLLAEDLPIVASHRMFVGKEVSLFEQMTDEDYEKAVKAEEEKKDKLLRIVDLRNAGSKGIEFENMRRIVKAFGASETDTGSPEVQGKQSLHHVHWSFLFTSVVHVSCARSQPPFSPPESTPSNPT